MSLQSRRCCNTVIAVCMLSGRLTQVTKCGYPLFRLYVLTFCFNDFLLCKPPEILQTIVTVNLQYSLNSDVDISY
ncbi:hypothetical protein K435DRAFT_57771 [Dendrothele bispora CBS 962.96]|uniref:Uncharacterized protein n=1 Tax=Dendrothele bispora (strain CBS 962.96) TaxID=1314807 RepID=A0A4S8M5T3_DENBC|nr:hypothetical protein K435DRAFT_57771 [Dendrothele bispora CBS 962.96]